MTWGVTNTDENLSVNDAVELGKDLSKFGMTYQVVVIHPQSGIIIHQKDFTANEVPLDEPAYTHLIVNETHFQNAAKLRSDLSKGSNGERLLGLKRLFDAVFREDANSALIKTLLSFPSIQDAIVGMLPVPLAPTIVPTMKAEHPADLALKA